MDQKYERMIHNELVKVSCGQKSGQYFLITPKLLPALNYHPRMKILCVNNGEWLDFADDTVGLRNGQIATGNMMNMIDRMLARRTVAAAAWGLR